MGNCKSQGGGECHGAGSTHTLHRFYTVADWIYGDQSAVRWAGLT